MNLIPDELPDLRRVGLLAIDSEERDNGLQADRGSSWPWRDGHVCGISVAYRADGEVRGLYLPMRHPDTQCFPPEQVYAWLAAHVACGPKFLTHNGPFDWGWFRSEAGIRMPPSERIEELGALATLTNENRRDYGLDALAKSCGFPGKDESLLREGCTTLELVTNKRKKFRPQSYLWQLPARYVAAYAVADAINTLLVFDQLNPILDRENTRAAYELDRDLVPLIVEMRARGIRIDIAAAEQARDLLLGKRDAVLAQLSDKLGMPVSMDELNRSRWKAPIFDREKVKYPRTEKGSPSFTGNWMEGHPHWLPQLICEAEKYHRAGDKFVGNYILGHAVNGRIYAEIHPFRSEDHGTKSFRFSYSDPPLQQMTAHDEEFAPIIRGLFLPDEGEVWAKPDASQQEFRLAVHYAAIHNMPKAEIAVARYRDDPNTDFHLLTAQLTGLARQEAKNTNFAKIYGAGVRKFAEMTGLPLDRSRQLYAQYDREMPFLRALSKGYEYLARQQGYITLYDGARRHFNLWVPAGKWEKGAGPCEREEAERRLADPAHKWFDKGQLYRADCHNALNALIQGSAARHTKLWMRAVWREGIVPLLQMHDCLDCSVATREQAEIVARLCVEMVQLKVPMRCDLKFGRTWGDAKHSWEELHGDKSAPQQPKSESEIEPKCDPALKTEPGCDPAIEYEPEPEPVAAQSNGHGQPETTIAGEIMGAYAQYAGVLIERGYAAIPIMAGTKAPGFECAGVKMPLPKWQRRFLDRTPSAYEREVWGKGDTGVGVVGGRASRGLIGVDIDTDDPAIKSALLAALPATPVKKVGQKGETAFYYGPDVPSRSWNIAGRRVCDLIADGRQTVLPPTIHEKTGQPYRWLGPSLDAFKPEELPRLPVDIVARIDGALAPLGWQPPARAGNGGVIADDDDSPPHRQLNSFALVHLERWVPALSLYKCRPARGGYEAVAHWRESSTGRELNERKRNLKIHPNGIKDFGDGAGGTYTPLDLVMAANDCDLDTAFKFLSEHTGWTGAVWINGSGTVPPTAAEKPEAGSATRLTGSESKAENAEAKAEQSRIQAEPSTPPVDLWGKLTPPPLPHGVLPSVIENFAREQGTTMGADPAGLAVAALVVCAAAVPDSIRLRVKLHSDWTEATRLWVALVGNPSTMKTPILNQAAEPLNRIDNELRRAYRVALDAWEALDKATKQATPRPRHTRVRVNDISIESAQDILRDSPNGVLYLRDELSGFFGSMDKYSGSRGAAADRGFWLQAYNGGAYSYDRVMRGSGHIERLSVSVLGGIQPEPMRKLVEDAVDDGLIQRLVPIVLRPAQNGRDEPMSDATIDYETLVERLHYMQPRIIDVLLGDAARALRQELENKHRELVRATVVNKKLAAHVGKYDGIFARLCLLWHCIESPGTEPLPVVSEECAGRVAEFLSHFLLPHAAVFYTDVYGLADDHDRLANVAGYILAHKIERLTNRVIQRGDCSMRGLKRYEIENVCHQLSALGWVTEGQRRRATDPPCWDVNPEVHRLYREHAEREAERRQRDKAMLAEMFAKPKGEGT